MLHNYIGQVNFSIVIESSTALLKYYLKDQDQKYCDNQP